MRQVILLSCLLTALQGLASAQGTPSALTMFFKQRLAEPPDAIPPSYDSLWKVTSGIADSSANEVSAALPYIFEALKRDERDLSIQAELPLFAIGRRPDGGLLLGSKVDEIGALLDRSDERLSGGATGILRNIMPSRSDIVVPLIINHLQVAAKPRLVEVELAAMLLDFRKGDPQAMKTIDDFLSKGATPEVTVATLKMLGAHHAGSTPGINAFSLRALGDSNKYVKIAAIYTVHSLGSTTWDQAQPALSKLASDAAEDKDVKAIANKALTDDLSKSPRQIITPAQ